MPLAPVSLVPGTVREWLISGGPSKGSQSMPALLRALFGLHTLGLPSCSLPY